MTNPEMEPKKKSEYKHWCSNRCHEINMVGEGHFDARDCCKYCQPELPKEECTEWEACLEEGCPAWEGDIYPSPKQVRQLLKSCRKEERKRAAQIVNIWRLSQENHDDVFNDIIGEILEDNQQDEECAKHDDN